MSPKKVLLFFLLVGVIILPAVVFFPANGIQIGAFRLKMISINNIIGKDTVKYTNIDNIIGISKNIDSLPDILKSSNDTANFNSEKFKASVDNLSQSIYRMEYGLEGKNNLYNFFKLLRSGITNKEQIRILHYGDSQIEGDRITAYLRNKLQQNFGGFGPGLLPVVQPYDSYFSAVQSNAGRWYRYTIFNNKDPRINHNRFGVLAAFSRFAPAVPVDESFIPDNIYSASFQISESKIAYSNVRKFKRLRIFYGNSNTKVEVKISAKGKLLIKDSLEAKVNLSSFNFNFPEYVKNVKIEFSGYDSPDIYAIDLSDKVGLEVDNISMRGASGTMFTRMNFIHLQAMYKTLNVKMFILQFGGNVIPYTTGSVAIENYGNWFYNQLILLKKMMPEATIIVVGPSDMSHKVGEDYVTYENLPKVRDALRSATLKAGYSYWDMYMAMGGYNSMPSWVSARPSLAGVDYTHFTPTGAKLIANMFYNALMMEFKESEIIKSTAKK
ncbi:MAG: hypothetical protein AUJ98_00075 [Bacteroidetes bacterium CG2_30_33_31]|nr:MAG: hypothetical protein AUJ98_00075 [Bacteroidetes bacterium CG2_30_33_31]